MQRLTRSVTIVLALALGLTAPARAGDLKLEIKDGRVTLVARDVTVRQILAEWARVGQTKVVNGDRVPGGPVTLQLVDVPERQALDVLLRSVTGYLAAPRRQAVADASQYDRILVVPTVRAASTAASVPTSQDPNARFRGPAMGSGRAVPDDQEDLFGASNPNMPGNPNYPGMTNPNYPGPVPNMPGMQAMPAGGTVPAYPAGLMPAVGQPASQPPPNPSMPWLPSGTATPGVVAKPVPTPPKGPGRPGGA